MAITVDSMKKSIKIFLGLLLLLILALLIITRLTLGAGRDYPDLSSEPLYSASDLEVVATMEYPR